MRRLIRIVVAVVALGLIYTFVLEPRWLEVTHHERQANVDEPVTIAVLGDVHAQSADGIVQAVNEALADAEPDLILIGGDLVHASRNHAAVESFLAALPEAPLGSWLVPGNWEHWVYGTRTEDMYAPGRAKWLVNTSTRVRDDLWIGGVDDALAGTPRPDAVLAHRPDRGVRIVLMHSPSGAPPFMGEVDYVFAAHTHGGQVRLPFFGEIVLPPGTGDYVMGWYPSDRGTETFVTRGIGTSVIGARFFCRPELALIRLSPASPGEAPR